MSQKDKFRDSCRLPLLVKLAHSLTCHRKNVNSGSLSDADYSRVSRNGDHDHDEHDDHDDHNNNNNSQNNNNSNKPDAQYVGNDRRYIIYALVIKPGEGHGDRWTKTALN